MNKDNTCKQYESLKIPDRQELQRGGTEKSMLQSKNDAQHPLSDGLFYEIEYDVNPQEGNEKPVLTSQPLEPPENDEIRELFNRMRDVAHQYRTPFTNYSRFFDKSVQQASAKIFYEQAVLMKDFEDDYTEVVPFSSYFPYYQMLSYEQLRTYFTWRGNVRKGVVNNTSLSYVFLYIYELLGNIGADNPQDGLDKLVSFWTSFQKHDSTIDKYVIRWLKDYHIYYELPEPFKDFAEKHHLTQHYPKISGNEDGFDLFCNISKYDIRKSVFFTDETSKLITDCFYFVLNKIRQDFEAAGIAFDDALFRPTKKIITWRPFKDALFYPWLKQPERRVIISENEIYLCHNNEWTFSTIITTEKGKQFIGYVMKQMESVLRKVTDYKFKITANIDMINQETLSKLNKLGLYIENIVPRAVIEFYKEATKTVVTVDLASLTRIRQEALTTQASLLVEEEAEPVATAPNPVILPVPDQFIFSDPSDKEPSPASGGWERLRDSLSESELQALALILQGDGIKKFADQNNIMLEVLADGINGKAMDHIGDNLLDAELAIYEDYIELVKGMVEEI